MTQWTENLYQNVSNVEPHEPHEPPSDYEPGGYHPVALQDSFHDGRYVVKHKLGFGGQATVWRGWDGGQRYVIQFVL